MTMAAPVTPPPRRSFGRRTNLVLFIGMVVGLALVLGAIATNSDIMLLCLPLVLVCAGALFICPAVTLALPPFRSRPAADRVALRIPAVLSAIALAPLGSLWAQAAECSAWC